MLTSSVNPSVFGQSVTFTATVVDASSNPITCGSVTFNDGATPFASNVPLGSPSSDQAQATTSSLAIGNHNITAVYNPGACLYLTSTSNTVVQAVFSPLKVMPFGINFPGSVYGGVSGSTTGPVTVTATNQSMGTVHIGTVTVATTSGPGPGPNFGIASDTCSGAALAPGASCTVGVTFAASAVSVTTNDFHGTLTVPSDQPNSPQIVTLAGTGLKGQFQLTANLSFSSTQVGTTNATTGIGTVTNLSTVPLVIDPVTSVTGDFAIQPSFGCSTTGTTTLAPNGSSGSSCTIGVSFTPTQQGSRTGSVGVTSSFAKNSPATMALKGTGTLAALTFSPGALQFGGVPHGTTSADKIETVTNPNPSVMGANTNVVVSGITTTSTPTGSIFNIDPAMTTCGTSPSYATTLAPGASCTVAVNFSPATTITYTGTLNASDNAGTGLQKATLYGTGQ